MTGDNISLRVTHAKSTANEHLQKNQKKQVKEVKRERKQERKKLGIEKNSVTNGITRSIENLVAEGMQSKIVGD